MSYRIRIFISLCLALQAWNGFATTVSELQEMLQTLGYPIGKADGHWGKKSREALKQFQSQQGLSATGKIDAATEQALQLRIKSKTVPQSQPIDVPIANAIKTELPTSLSTPPNLSIPPQAAIIPSLQPVVTNPVPQLSEKPVISTATSIAPPPTPSLPLTDNSNVNKTAVKTAPVAIIQNPIVEAPSGIKFVRVPGGCFTMGGGNFAVHDVCVHNNDSFLIGQYEVTQSQWQNVMGSNPSSHTVGNDYPVENVSWNDVQEFIAKLNKLDQGRYRLPTEAEWEYSARAKTKTAYWWGTDQPICKPGAVNGANFNGDDSCPHSTTKVGTYQANAFGLYDVHGNVWEWVEDVYTSDAYQRHEKQNPVLIEGGTDRVFRGGSWLYSAEAMAAFNRDHAAPNFQFSHLGLRLIYQSK